MFKILKAVVALATINDMAEAINVRINKSNKAHQECVAAKCMALPTANDTRLRCKCDCASSHGNDGFYTRKCQDVAFVQKSSEQELFIPKELEECDGKPCVVEDEEDSGFVQIAGSWDRKCLRTCMADHPDWSRSDCKKPESGYYCNRI